MRFLIFIFVEFLLPFSISALFFEWHWPTSFNYNKDEKMCPPLRSGNVKHFRRVVSYGKVQPDNYIQRGILTNGHFPARPINVCQGDTLIVECVNKLDEPFTLHFHGLLQMGTVRSDGVPYVTQKPIMPNSTYYYIINTMEQVGTFIYHAHTGLDIVWVFAPFIIHDCPNDRHKKPLKSYDSYHYDEERTLTITQCWHESIESMSAGLTAAPFQDIPDTASILINGQSYGIWSKNNGNSKGFYVVNVKPNKCYRFRLISVCSDSAVQFFIEKHAGHVIETDGIITNPAFTEHLNINSAQRYSYLVCMDQPIGNYRIRAKMMPGPGPDNGVAILHYEGAEDPTLLRKQLVKDLDVKEIKDEPDWLAGKLCPSDRYPQPEIVYPVPRRVDQDITIRTFQRTTTNGSKHFEVNRKFNPVPATPLIDVLQDQYFRLSTPGIFELHVGNFIQIVFINHVGSDGICEQHPWHLHGHTFYIVGEGADDFRPKIEGEALQKNIDLVSKHGQSCFPMRDVLTLFPNQTNSQPAEPGSPCGWIAVRFVANNPGIWLGHCHLTAHLIMGKRFEMYEHDKEDPFLRNQCYYNGHYRKPY